MNDCDLLDYCDLKGHVPEQAGFLRDVSQRAGKQRWWMEAGGFSGVVWERHRSGTGVWEY